MSRHLERGWMLYRMGRHQESLTEFGQARCDPASRAEAAVGMAFAFLGLNKAAKAASHAEAALGEQPDYWLGHWALGNALKLQRKLKKSEQHIREALRLQPGKSSLHAELSSISLLENRLKDSESAARTGLGCDPSDFGCRYALVSSLLAQKRFEEASGVAFETLTIHPDLATAHELYALTMVHQEDFAKAQQHALEALRINPTNGEARELYVLTLKNSYPVYSALVRSGMKVVRFFNRPALFASMSLYLPCLICWLAIAASFSLITGAITDIAFATKKETRRLLTPAEKAAAPWLAMALVFFVLALTLGLSNNSDSAIFAGLSAICLLHPARTIFKRLKVGIRDWYFYLTCLTAAVAILILPASVLVPASILHPIGFSTFVLSIMLALLTLSSRLLKLPNTTE